jgi:hypothetical protein
MKRIAIIAALILIVAAYFGHRTVGRGLLPIPADTIVGLYHPYRDFFAASYPRGIPFKNFLVTDPVRQQYPWKSLSMGALKSGTLPLWNPYVLGGTPLLATFQPGVFYPLNVLFFLLPFPYAWSILVILQPILACVLMYLYLRNLNISKIASFLGGFLFAFSGFSIAWMSWNTIVHTALWLPLVLLSIDKVVLNTSYHETKRMKHYWERFVRRDILFWLCIYTFSLIASFFAGHLQTFFYLFLFSTLYLGIRFRKHVDKRVGLLFVGANLVVGLATIIQWLPTLQFILLSARNVDQADWMRDGWFIPWQHLIQFIIPDFFGNPTTLNYWGVWNYGEFIGYISLFPLIMALSAIFYRRDQTVLFFVGVTAGALLLALPTPFAAIPYYLQIPFISSSQPTRLLFIIDFSLIVLAAIGMDDFLRHSKKHFSPFVIVGGILVCLWVMVLLFPGIISQSVENVSVAKRNLLLPSFVFSVVFLAGLIHRTDKGNKLLIPVIVTFLLVTIVDLLRFADKFLPYSQEQYLYPETKAIRYLKEEAGYSRIMAVDRRIIPPNFTSVHGLYTIEGYDPLFLRRYAELIAASERNKPDISPPFGFNRIITAENFNGKIVDLLGVKYILSLSDLSSPNLRKVFQEGETRIYENRSVLPRAFFVRNIVYIQGDDKKKAIDLLFSQQFNPRQTAIVEGDSHETQFPRIVGGGSAEVVQYNENVVRIATEVSDTRGGFLVLTDTYYPTWRARIHSEQSEKYRELPILRTDYTFRGVFVPQGRHEIEFYNTLL